MIAALIILAQASTEAPNTIRLDFIQGYSTGLGTAGCLYADPRVHVKSGNVDTIEISVVGHKEDCPKSVWYDPTGKRVFSEEPPPPPREPARPSGPPGMVVVALKSAKYLSEERTVCVYGSPILVLDYTLNIEGGINDCRAAIWINPTTMNWMEIQ